MDIHRDLDAMKMLAKQKAKEHKCNYNVILFNPDANGQFIKGSTYEMVADSYFEKDRPNVRLICKTDWMFEKGDRIIWHSHFGYDIGEFQCDAPSMDNYTIQLLSGKFCDFGMSSVSRSEVFKYSEELVVELTKKYGYEKKFSNEIA